MVFTFNPQSIKDIPNDGMEFFHPIEGGKGVFIGVVYPDGEVSGNNCYPIEAEEAE